MLADKVFDVMFHGHRIHDFWFLARHISLECTAKFLCRNCKQPGHRTGNYPDEGIYGTYGKAVHLVRYSALCLSCPGWFEALQQLLQGRPHNKDFAMKILFIIIIIFLSINCLTSTASITKRKKKNPNSFVTFLSSSAIHAARPSGTVQLRKHNFLSKLFDRFVAEVLSGCILHKLGSGSSRRIMQRKRNKKKSNSLCAARTMAFTLLCNGPARGQMRWDVSWSRPAHKVGSSFQKYRRLGSNQPTNWQIGGYERK